MRTRLALLPLLLAAGAAGQYPDAAANGPRHNVSGVIKSVQCLPPAVLVIALASAGKTLTVYSNDYYKLSFYTMNFKPQGDLKPCTGLEGMKARIEYAEVTDKTAAAGQIVKVELSK